MKKRIGIISLNVFSFNKKGFYNMQDIGLAKGVAPFFEEVIVYRIISKKEDDRLERIDRNISVLYLSSSTYGSNGAPNLSKLDPSLEVLVCFSDTQIMFPKLYYWSKKFSVKLIPYIGVVKSNSIHWYKRLFINFLFFRNLSIYKRLTCLAKTPYIADSLNRLGVKDVIIAPVGLDSDILKSDYERTSINSLKSKFGFHPEDKIILFVGRMTKEKQPQMMIEIFKRVYSVDNSYRLVMVGNGELSGFITCLINELNINKLVKRIDSIKNEHIWQLYRISDCFVNLNKNEIYGMALLEAMYYDCKVVAWNAPGPNFTITNGKTGWIVDSVKDCIDNILDRKVFRTRDYVMSNFLWKKSAEIIRNITI